MINQCEVCAKALADPRAKYCSEKHRRRASYLRHRERHLARDRARYRADKAGWIARVREYEAKNPERVRAWFRKYRKECYEPCPYCGKRRRGASSCLRCRLRFGNLCKNNPDCGVQVDHKHCPRCFMPIVKPSSRFRALEECSYCQADASRGAYMGREEIAA